MSAATDVDDVNDGGDAAESFTRLAPVTLGAAHLADTGYLSMTAFRVGTALHPLLNCFSARLCDDIQLPIWLLRGKPALLDSIMMLKHVKATPALN